MFGFSRLGTLISPLTLGRCVGSSRPAFAPPKKLRSSPIVSAHHLSTVHLAPARSLSSGSSDHNHRRVPFRRQPLTEPPMNEFKTREERIAWMERVIHHFSGDPNDAENVRWGGASLSRSMKVLDVEPGKIKLEFHVQPAHLNGGGFMHGGCIATLIDMVSSYAILSLSIDGGSGVSIDLNTTYTSAGQLDERLVIVSEVTRHTQSLDFTHTVISHADGTEVARGSHTKFVKRANKIARL